MSQKDVLNWQIVCFEILPWRLPDRVRHSFHYEATLSQLLWHVPISKELPGKWEMQSRCASLPWRNSKWIYSNWWQTLTDRFHTPTQGEKRIHPYKQRYYRLGYPSYLEPNSSTWIIHQMTLSHSAIRTNHQANPFTLTPKSNDSHDTSPHPLVCQVTLLTPSLQNKHQLLQPGVKASCSSFSQVCIAVGH